VAELTRAGFGQLARRWQDLVARMGRLDAAALDGAALDAIGADAAGLPGTAGDGAAPGEARLSREHDADGLLRRLRETRAEIDQVLRRDRDESGAAIPGMALTYLIATQWGGLAIVVFDDRPWSAVWLPELTGGWAAAMAGRLLAASPEELESILPGLLDELRPLMGHVVDAADGLPIALIASGPLGMLPLQAATCESSDAAGTASTVPGLARVRHAPSARVLLRDGASPLERPAGAAVTAIVSDSSDLEYAAQEAQMASTALGTGRVIAAGQASETPFADAVLAALGQHGIVHFACHAAAVPARPLDSALLPRSDTRLSLRDILRAKVRADLVVLSACETAVPGDDLPDEVIGLPAGMLQAGAGGVIGTLWKVRDDTCLWFALSLYDQMRAGQPPWEALRAAQELLRTATTGQLGEYLRQLSGEGHPWPPQAAVTACREAIEDADPAERPFGHPVDWAGFAYIG
jgi:hypothetical protein